MTAPTAQTEQNTLLMIRHPKDALMKTVGDKGLALDLVHVARYLEGVAMGAAPGENWVDVMRGSTSAVPVHALAVVVLSSGSGTVGAVINGVSLTATWASSDAASSTLIAAAIRASSNALVQGLVGASNLGATITLASVAAGDYIEIQPVGTAGGGQAVRFTATAAAQSNGAGPGANPTFDISGNDTADATALAAAINAYPGFKGKLYCASAAAVVTIIQMFNDTTVRFRVQKSASTFTLSAAGAFAALASTVVWALQKGKLGNCQTIAATGTGVSILGSLTRLGGGVGGDPTAGATTYRR
jgi:hypothetical protein